MLIIYNQKKLSLRAKNCSIDKSLYNKRIEATYLDIK